MSSERLDDFADRTEQPTELRLREARQRGQVARSADFTSAAAAAGLIVALGVAGPALLGALTRMTAAMLDGRHVAAGGGDWTEGLASAAAAPAAIVLAVLVAAAAVAALADLIQVGPMVATERIRPDVDRLGLAAAARRLFSLRTAVRALLIAAKLAVVAGVLWWRLRPAVGRPWRAAGLDAWSLTGEAGAAAWSAGLWIAAALTALGAADWLYQRWQHRRDLRMSPWELRQELRRTEGDERLRHRRRAAARKLGDGRIARHGQAGVRGSDA